MQEQCTILLPTGAKSAFEELMLHLVSAPVLAYRDFNPDAGSFILDIDASQHPGIGTFLSQLQSDGMEQGLYMAVAL